MDMPVNSHSAYVRDVGITSLQVGMPKVAYVHALVHILGAPFIDVGYQQGGKITQGGLRSWAGWYVIA